jgi:hypothetical protein
MPQIVEAHLPQAGHVAQRVPSPPQVVRLDRRTGSLPLAG